MSRQLLLAQEEERKKISRELHDEIAFYEEVRVWMAKFDAAERQSRDEPIPEEISENLTSDVADLASSGKNRYGGALTAAAFLREFVGDERSWAHLDIAGPAWNGKGAYDYTPKAGTGFAVRTLVALARDLAG